MYAITDRYLAHLERIDAIKTSYVIAILVRI